MDSGRFHRFTRAIAPALLVVLPLCLFGPHTVYTGNEAEFTASFWALVRPLLLAGGVLAAVLAMPTVLLSGRPYHAYLSLLFGLGLVIWIQGSFLIADYGAFTGEAIDWSAHDWRNPYEIALWAAVPLLAVLASRYVSAIAPFASGVLVALQLGSLVVAEVRADSSTRPAWQGPSDALFDLSRTRNIIHIVLDGFQSEFFHEVLEEERSRLDRSFGGSVFFADHAGAFPSTIVSIPAMLTGTVYRNERDLQQYLRDHFERGSLYKALRGGGYRVDSITEIQYDSQSATNVFRIPKPYVSYGEYTRFVAWQLADLSLFRHAPHELRPWIHNNGEWRLQTRLGPGDTRSRHHLPVNGAAVLGELAERLTVRVDEPLYKFIHVGIPHMPIAVDRDCQFTGVRRATRERYKGQARCAVMRVAAILDRLQQLGVYDSSLIVIASDHGVGLAPVKLTNARHLPAGWIGNLAGRALALLIVKPPGSRGPVRVSFAPTAITDIAATVLDAAGVAHALPGEPALKLGETADRPRQFAMYDWEHEDWRQQYFDWLDLVDINGRLLDGNSWRMKDSLYAPNAPADMRARGLYELHRSRSGAVYRWSMPHAFFHAPQNMRSFQLKVRSIASMPQTVSLLVGDRVIDTAPLTDQSWTTLAARLPASTGGPLWVEMRVDPPWRAPTGGRMLGVQTRDVQWTP
jgi:hypothetical protein